MQEFVSFISTSIKRLDRRLLPVQAGVLLAFAVVPIWGRLYPAPPPFTYNYVTGFLIFFPIVWTIGAWLALGLPGFNALRRDQPRAWWMLILLMLALVAFASTEWAFIRHQRPEVTPGMAVQLGLAMLFVLVVACSAPHARVVVMVLAISAVVQGIVGGLQVATQGSIGLSGEFALDPQREGTSIILAGDLRWLRPYGLTAHPNIFAGYLVVGLLALAGIILAERGYLRWVGVVAFLFGLWILFLSFSRGGLLGFAGGGASLIPLVWRRYGGNRVFRRYALGLLVVIGVFVVGFAFLYAPLLLARVGVGMEETEVRSVNERAMLIYIAEIVIEEYPLLGVGIGNFSWYASYYLHFKTDLDMRGDNLHHALLSAQAELGIPGSVLVMVGLGVGVEIALRRVRNAPDSIYRYALLAGALALGVIGLFDHYTWTLIHFQVLWWGLLALAGRPVSSPENVSE